MYFMYYSMLPRKFCCIYDYSSAFSLFDIVMSLHLESCLSFQEIIRPQNIFRAYFYIPLESHYMVNLELFKTMHVQLRGTDNLALNISFLNISIYQS